MKLRFFAIVLCLVPAVCLAQVKSTTVKGKIADATTGEALPFVQVYFDGTQIGTTTDIDGRYLLENEKGYVTVMFKMVGYKTEVKSVQYGTNAILNVEMRPTATQLTEVTIRPKERKRERYRRRDNPAVELARNVIQHKWENRVESNAAYTRRQYRKVTLALDNFDLDFDSSRFWNKYSFVQQYVDYSQPTNPCLGFSLREMLGKEQYRRNPPSRSAWQKALRSKGLDKILDREGLSVQLDQILTPIDIYDGDIEIMLNHFVGPLSNLAIGFYKYYILDTVEVEGERCVQLSFVPVNKESYGFVGDVFVTCDSTFSVRKYNLMVSSHINLNFVTDLSISGTFVRDADGRLLPQEEVTTVKLSLHKKMKQILARQTVVYDQYEIDDTLALDTLPASMPDSVWNSLRPRQLTGKEVISQQIVEDFKRIPVVRTGMEVGSMLVGGYLSTSRNSDSSIVDLGPVYNLLSFNTTEGLRLRLGGMTTAMISPKNYVNGYLAYGFRDHQPKGSVTYIHTFQPHERHPFQGYGSFFSARVSYDLEELASSSSIYDRDNILMSSFQFLPMQYVGQAQLRLHHQWSAALAVDTKVGVHRFSPAEGVLYERLMADGSTQLVSHIGDVEWEGQLSFSPGTKPTGNRLGKGSLFSLNQEALSISLSHKMGYTSDGFFYNNTEASAEKRFWLSSFGHVDLSLKMGRAWGRTPWQKLFVPSASASLFMSAQTFCLMRPLEFVTDQYASLFATYYLKGWILNRIPLVKRLHLREVVSFAMLYGGLSPQNNPEGGQVGLYRLPDGCQPLGTAPYMECSVGLENVFRFIRIDYVWRLSYAQNLSQNQRGGIRIGFRFAL